MPINMTDYKMIIHERIYNVLQIMIDFGNEPIQSAQSISQRLMSAAGRVPCSY